MNNMAFEDIIKKCKAFFGCDKCEKCDKCDKCGCDKCECKCDKSCDQEKGDGCDKCDDGTCKD